MGSFHAPRGDRAAGFAGPPLRVVPGGRRCRGCGLRVPGPITGGVPWCSDSCRFWHKVDRSAGPAGCWLWRAAGRRHGYGMFKPSGERLMTAPRVAFLLTHGELPEGFRVRHHCGNPLCVNPGHLYLALVSQPHAERPAAPP